jgi:hypothetical protein
MEELFNQKQHFLPEAYLRQFTADQKGFFHRLKFGSEGKEIREVHVSNVCFGTNFYDIDNIHDFQGLGINNRRFIEGSFKYENKLSEILNKLRSRQLFLDRKEFETLVDAYVSFKHRGPSYRKEVKKLQQEGAAFDEVTNNLKQDLSWLIEHHKFDYDGFIEKYKTSFQRDTSYPRSMHLRSLIETSMDLNEPVADAVTKILSMNINVLEVSNGGDYFFVTDNPGYSLLGDRMFSRNYGAFDRIIWPVNSKQAIQLVGFDSLNYIRPLRRIQYIKINSSNVNEINKMLFMIADECIFCENRDFLNAFKSVADSIRREQEVLISNLRHAR